MSAPPMSAAAPDIARRLDQAKHRRGRVILAAAAAGALASGSAALLLGAVVIHLGVRPGPVRWVALALALLAPIGAAAWAWRTGRRQPWTAAGTARALAGGSAPLRDDLVSAVELLEARPALAASGGVSLELLDAHVERAARALGAVDLAAAIPDRPARRAGVALLGVAVLYLVALGAGGRPLGRAWLRLVAGDPAQAAGPALEPITGDIELTYGYPAHTHRPPQTLSGTGGEIRAPKGTEITLKTRSDRPVEAAEIELSLAARPLPAPAVPAPGSPPAPTAAPTSPPDPASSAAPPAAATPPPAPEPLRRVALAVTNGRDLAGTFVMPDGGTYRFRFRTSGGRTVAEGPPIPMVVEPDAFPSVRITAPAGEIEVKADATVEVDWQAEDDYGLTDLTLVTRTPGGAEHRRPVRALAGLRRDAGRLELPLQAERLSEGERLLYWLEVLDGDTVSGPKKGASATQSVRLYSEAEHRRQAMEKARAAWEELVTLLADRLETFAAGGTNTPERLTAVVALDARTRALHERLRQVAAEILKDRAAPREVGRALENVASQVRAAEQRVTANRQALMRALGLRQPAEAIAPSLAVADRLLVEALERGVLYLEQLFDKARAEDLVRMAKDLAAGRRDLAQLLERYREAPSEAAKQEALAQLRRLRQRLDALMARMAETARGFHDEHMNAEAMAEMSRQKDMGNGLDEAEKALERGDVAAAMKALDQMAGQIDQMMAGLQRTAGRPDEAQAALMKEMLAFKKELEEVQSDQARAAEETAKVKQAQRQRLAGPMEKARQEAARLAGLAKEAGEALRQAQPGTPQRSEAELDAAREAAADLERALTGRDLDAAQETVQRALGPTRRLAASLEEDAALSERLPGAVGKEPAVLREAQRHASQAGQKLAEVAKELQKAQPDPRRSLTPGEAAKLDELAKREQGLERRAGELQQKLSQLMQQAPVFPQGAAQMLGEGRGHMGQAAGELSQRNAPRAHGEQQQALDALGRFQKGLEQMAKKGGQGGGGGFPFPFGEPGGDGRDGDSGDPTPEKVAIPDAQAHKGAEAFRRDLLEAMKQGAPERYRGEVQRYYEELVK